MVLDTPLLNTQHYKVRIKGKCSYPGKGVAPSLHFGVVSIEKEVFGSPLTTVARHTYRRDMNRNCCEVICVSILKENPESCYAIFIHNGFKLDIKS